MPVVHTLSSVAPGHFPAKLHTCHLGCGSTVQVVYNIITILFCFVIICNKSQHLIFWSLAGYQGPEGTTSPECPCPLTQVSPMLPTVQEPISVPLTPRSSLSALWELIPLDVVYNDSQDLLSRVVVANLVITVALNVIPPTLMRYSVWILNNLPGLKLFFPSLFGKIICIWLF